MARYRIVTADDATDYDDPIEASIKHCRNVATNVGSLIMRTFEDALPDEVVRTPQIIDSYSTDPVRTERERRFTWHLGEAQPAFPEREEAPMAWTSSAAEWRVRAFYYALGQIESMFDLSTLVEGDAVSFSYHFQGFVEAGATATNHGLRAEWEHWSQLRRTAIERDGITKAVVGGRPAPRAGVDYLDQGEHDPTLGPDMSDGRD